MKLENQLTNLKLSQKLKELGVKQKSQFYWTNLEWERREEDNFAITSGKVEWHLENSKVENKEYKDNYYSAFTCAELGEMLKWKEAIIFGLPEKVKELLKDNDTEANFRAKMLIYLYRE